MKPSRLRLRPVPLVPFDEATAHVASHDFLEIEGQRIHVRVSGEGPPLLLLHGFMASHYSFRRIVPELARHFRVISIDLNGFGLTERPASPEAYRIGDQADLVVRVLEKIGATPVTILGHSYGAAVASVTALRHPEAVRGLILVSPASRFDKLPWYLKIRAGKEVLYFLCRRLLSHPEHYRRISERAFHVEGSHTEEDSETYRGHLLVEGLRSTFFGLMEMLGGKGFGRIPFEEIQAPALVLAGDRDIIIPLEQCREVAEQLPGGRLEILEECGHSGPEERPDEVIAALLSFVAQCRF
ncbi:MAG: alpha/beta hydrolase [Verrucomicrobiales bacterium]|nr:alpha/beta hydrolase [Verrucomicrobiales bacterium]